MTEQPLNYLILVRHSLPEIDADVPAAQWILSAEGRQRCIDLAQELRPYHPDRLLVSIEPKAQQTAGLLAQELDRPMVIIGGLHEHERSSVPFSSQEEFRAKIKALFDQPDELVFGDETANQAYRRFSAAIDSILSQFRGHNVAIITHGTVMTIWLARTCNVSPYSFWSDLGLPSFVILSRPDLKIDTVVNTIPKKS